MTSTPTILRIKRRRRDDHEALDALVIEPPARPSKRSRPSLGDALDGDQQQHGLLSLAVPANKGIFRFAETVSSTAFDTEASKRSLRDRITSLISHPPPRLASSDTSTTSSPRQSRFASSSNLNALSSAQAASPAHQSAEAERKKARYRIVEERRINTGYSPSRPDQAHSSHRRPTAPPVVRSTAINTASSKARDLRIIEATIESDNDEDNAQADPMHAKLNAYAQQRKQRLAQQRQRDISQNSHSGHYSLRNPSRGTTSLDNEEEDEAMRNLMPMLREYLSLQTPIAPVVKSSPGGNPNAALQAESGKNLEPASSEPGSDNTPPHPGFETPPDLSAGDAADDDSEWVYDVYYRDISTSVAGTSVLSSDSAGLDVASADGLRKIGQLTGLEDDEILADGDGEDDQDSDHINTDDEDSNEEDFYRNDYPEGEDQDSADEYSDASVRAAGNDDDDNY